MSAAVRGFTPPIPDVPDGALGLLPFLRAVRTNALNIWPRAAYTEPSVVIRQFGRVRMLLNDPDAIHRVLVANPDNYARSPASIRILRPVVGNGLLLSEGDAWRHQRRTIAPALAPRSIPVLARHIAAASVRAVARLGAETAVDVLDMAQNLALDIAAQSMFSLEMGRFGAELRTMLAGYSDRLGRPYLLDMMLPVAWSSPHDYARRRFARRWAALIDRLIAARLETPPADPPRDLLDLLRAARDPQTGEAFSREALREQTATMIVAGHATTATTLFWALYLLASAPETQDWLAREVAGVDLGGDQAADALPRLVRTRAVVDETLRLYPAAFTMARVAIAADQAGAVAVPAGALVLVSPWVLHRHHAFWPDPERFVADRFLDARPPPRFAYLPFGAGPRVCVGAQFALAEATIALGALVQAFRFRLLSSRPVLPKPVVTTLPDHAPLFAVTPRT